MVNKLDISNLINRESDKICYIVGHGPSLTEHLEKLSKLDDNHIIVSVNDVDTFTGLVPDYWITCNHGYPIELMSSRVNQFPNTKYIYSDIIDLTPYDVVESLMKVEYFNFDFLHFKKSANSFFVKGQEFGCRKAWIPCCTRIKDRLTIQELLMSVSGYDNHYSTGDTSILHAIAIGLIVGCKVVNLYGIDLDYSKGYVNGHMTNEGGASHGDSFDFWMDRLQSDFYIINESAKRLSVEMNYFGSSQVLKNIFDNSTIPNKVYPVDCKNYD